MKILIILTIITFGVFASMPLHAETQDFDSLPAGTVVAGELPDGGTAPGTIFSGFSLSVTNTGGGPSSLVIFDSSNPTGGDADLGTPNQAFGGPGVGSGGASAPGANTVPLYNLLVCAENIHDWNNDGLVDDPDDEAGGCSIEFNFNEIVNLDSISLVDIDNESVVFQAYAQGLAVGNGVSEDLGGNSLQILDLSSFSNVDQLIVEFSGSGAIAELVFHSSSVATRNVDLSTVKAMYRDTIR